MAEHEHGKMDIDTQEKTFGGFVKTVSWGAIIVAADPSLYCHGQRLVRLCVR